MIIDQNHIEGLAFVNEPNAATVAAILGRAEALRGISLEEAGMLLNVRSRPSLEDVYDRASRVKAAVFGSRVVMFAPLYLSNYCTNGCLYCGFRATNAALSRRALTPEDAVAEARKLEESGFKRILLVTGEDRSYALPHIISCVKAIYEETGIRIVHVNAPVMDVESFRELKAAGVGVYQSFQETYHKPTYERMHPTGMKRDYAYRIGAMDRAIQAGFSDVGIGALFGLYDFRFDALASIAHSERLYAKYGAHAHTISIPRLRPAAGSALTEVPYPMTDEDLKLVVAVFRLAVPSAGVVVSTREGEELRKALLHVGATQLSAGSRTDPGGYTHDVKETLEQFSTSDRRTLSEVMASVAADGFMPSLCTTCYRVGRTGRVFTEKAMSGEMNKFCQANAILSLKEYVRDCAKNGERLIYEKAISSALAEVGDEAIKKQLLEKLKELDAGKRDLYF